MRWDGFLLGSGRYLRCLLARILDRGLCCHSPLWSRVEPVAFKLLSAIQQGHVRVVEGLALSWQVDKALFCDGIVNVGHNVLTCSSTAVDGERRSHSRKSLRRLRYRMSPVFYYPGLRLPTWRSEIEIPRARPKTEIVARLGVDDLGGKSGSTKGDPRDHTLAENQQRRREEHDQYVWNRFRPGHQLLLVRGFFFKYWLRESLDLQMLCL